jgi:hypothetical protein
MKTIIEALLAPLGVLLLLILLLAGILFGSMAVDEPAGPPEVYVDSSGTAQATIPSEWFICGGISLLFAAIGLLAKQKGAAS